MTTNGWLRVLALAEGATGLLLVTAPSLVSRLLLGSPVSGTGGAMARLAGVALAGLGVACWPGPAPEPPGAGALRGMVAYSAGAAAVLACLGAVEHVAGMLLWPAVGVHVAGGGLLLATRRG